MATAYNPENVWQNINEALGHFSRIRFHKTNCATGIRGIDAYHSKEENDGATVRKAGIEAVGTLIIDLETMLETKMTVEGSLTSGVADATSEASVELPVSIELTRELVAP